MALYTRPDSGTITTQYFLLDHLGSVAEITNSLGTLDVAENFAAYGERRDASDWSGPPSAGDVTLINGATQRGYTFHTNSESSSLIHMNGRMADSLTGRFLSADPYVFQPMLTQSFNRYSYVNNNPLTYTDPSGFCADPTGISAYVCGAVIGTALNYIGSKLFGKKKRPPPPKGCLGTASATGCYGKAVATKLFNMASDIYGLPRHRSSNILGVGEDRFGTGTCSWSPNCMSWDATEVFDVRGGDAEETKTAYRFLQEMLNTAEGTRLYEKRAKESSAKTIVDISCSGCGKLKYGGKKIGYVGVDGIVHVPMTVESNSYYTNERVLVSSKDPRVLWTHEVFGHRIAGLGNRAHAEIDRITNKIMQEIDPEGYIPADPRYACEFDRCK